LLGSKTTNPLTGKTTQWVDGALPLVKGRPTRWVMLNDVHVPHNVPLDPVLEFIKDYRPDYGLLVGDIINNDPFDHWARESARRAREMPEPLAYYADCNTTFYKPLRKAVGPNCRVVHWIGNHELWSTRAIDAMPEGFGYWEVENNIVEVDWWVANLGVANLGKLHFLHGDVLRGGKYHANSIMQLYRRNVRYGHFHDIQEASYNSPVDVLDRHTVRCCGTLQKFEPHFMKGRPHNWQHAFTYGVTYPDGLFWDTTAKVVDGRFHAEGRLYR